MKTEELKTIVEQRRKNCPFYGFYGGPGIFMDQQGNQCPHISGYAPCKMEISGLNPDWNDCYLSKNNSLEDFSSFEVSLFGIQEIISFKEWYEVVLGDKK